MVFAVVVIIEAVVAAAAVAVVVTYGIIADGITVIVQPLSS